MRIVTAGPNYNDIDAYAGIVAYAELLNAQGIEAKAVSTAPLNESVSKTARSWGDFVETIYVPDANDTFTLIDVSDPDWFEDFVDRDRVDEVIDHHPGFEEYWQQRIGDKATIDYIGAACTLVYEKWQKSGLLQSMSKPSARLLICGILDNTLNFQATVSTERDKQAYTELLKIADLPKDWPAQYFTECQEAILQDAVAAVKNDTKILEFKTYDTRVCIGQFAVWDGHIALEKHGDALKEALSAIQSDWFMNLISVGEGKSYFVSDSSKVQQWLEHLLGITFEGDLAVADRLWLRKEMLKEDIEKSSL